MDVQSVRKWSRNFAAGTEIHAKEKGGRPSIADEIVAKVVVHMYLYYLSGCSLKFVY